MNKIALIIGREYMSRVRKKSFVIMSLLGPLLFAATMSIVLWVNTRDGDHRLIQVIDESGLIEGKLESTDETTFQFIEADLEPTKGIMIESEEIFALLYIPRLDIDNPQGIVLYSAQSTGIKLESSIEGKIRSIVEDKKLLNSGIDQMVLDNLSAHIDLQTINLSDDGVESESSGGAAFAAGYLASFLLYMFIFLYGTQIMRGIIEEKTSRIIEVMIASVKPFQLMMGKILGIALVGITQFALWIVISTSLTSLATTLIVGGDAPDGIELMAGQETMADEEARAIQQEMVSEVMAAMEQINITALLISFIAYFLGGYLLYGALLAAIGAAVDSDADSQQFMLPVTLPLIFSMLLISVVIQDPHGSLSFWLSIIPFTSPIIMMMRLPFDVPTWEIVLSLSLLVVGFCFTTWVASRVYRIGIFMHGTKVNYKTLAKWFMMKS